MHPRIPRVAVNRGPNHAELDAGISAELAAVAAGARRRALRDGDRQVDTAHLLHSLLESDPEVREAFDGGARVARLLGYLVQRSIGYGLRWQSTVEDSGAVPVVRGTGWSPAAVAAMAAARERARLRGELRAHGVDLLAALAGDPECRAVEVLERAGVDAERLLRGIGPGREERVGGGQGGCASGLRPQGRGAGAVPRR